MIESIVSLKNRHMDISSVLSKKILNKLSTILKILFFLFLCTSVSVAQASQENTLVIEYQKQLLSTVIRPAFFGTPLDGHSQIIAIITSYLSITPRRVVLLRTEPISTLLISDDDRRVMFIDLGGVHTWYVETGECVLAVARSSLKHTFKVWNTHYVIECSEIVARPRSAITGHLIRGTASLSLDIDILCYFLIDATILVVGSPLAKPSEWVVKCWQPATNEVKLLTMPHSPGEEIKSAFVLDQTRLLLVSQVHVYLCNLDANVCEQWENMATIFAFPFCSWFSPDRQYMVTSHASGNSYEIITITNLKSVKVINAELNYVIYPIFMSRDNKIMIEEQWDYTEPSKQLILRYLNADTYVCLRSWYVSPDTVEDSIGSATISKDNKFLLYVARIGSTVIRVWNINTYQHVLTLYERQHVRNLIYEGPMFLSDINFLLTVSNDHQLQLIDVGYLHYENTQKIKQRLFIAFLERYSKCLLTKLFNQVITKLKHDDYQ